MKTKFCVAILISISGSLACAATAPAFAAASIRSAASSVQFEHDGATSTTPGTLIMRDVTVATCIKWAYGVQDSQISGPEWFQSERYDIIAKADQPASIDELKLMMQTLLAERFGLKFHKQSKELSAYALTIAKGGHKLKEASPGSQFSRQNSATGTIARAMTMTEFADFIAGPLRMPVVNHTALTGRYDFALDFTPYLPGGEQVMKVEFDNNNGIILAALQGELGLRLESRKQAVEVLVIDHAAPPSDN